MCVLLYERVRDATAYMNGYFHIYHIKSSLFVFFPHRCVSRIEFSIQFPFSLFFQYHLFIFLFSFFFVVYQRSCNLFVSAFLKKGKKIVFHCKNPSPWRLRWHVLHFWDSVPLKYYFFLCWHWGQKLVIFFSFARRCSFRYCIFSQRFLFLLSLSLSLCRKYFPIIRVFIEKRPFLILLPLFSQF